MDDLPEVKFASEDDIEEAATAIELMTINSSEHQARAVIAALEARGWRPSASQ